MFFNDHVEVFLSRRTAAMPYLFRNEDDYDIVYFDVEPGDVMVHNYRTAHGSRGNVSATRGSRAIAIRFGGDDLVYSKPTKPGVEFPIVACFKSGDTLDGEVFPVVWRRI